MTADNTNVNVQDYLRSKGLDDEEIAALAPEVEAAVGELYVAKYGGGNVAALDDHRDPDEIVGESIALPIVLGGGILTCGRCRHHFTAATWHVIEDRSEHGLHGGPVRWLDICFGCADRDPTLGRWADFCRAADVIDQLMVEASDQDNRDLFAKQIASVAEHFAAWRWPSGEEDAS